MAGHGLAGADVAMASLCLFFLFSLACSLLEQTH